jgi:hypothetical protein
MITLKMFNIDLKTFLLLSMKISPFQIDHFSQSFFRIFCLWNSIVLIERLNIFAISFFEQDIQRTIHFFKIPVLDLQLPKSKCSGFTGLI